MCGDKPSSWLQWLPLAEWWYNAHFHASSNTTPYEVMYGQPPPIHIPYLPEESVSATVDRTLSAREEALKVLKFHLERAQNRMSQYANSHRSARSFSIGSYVYLKLQPYRQFTLRRNAYHKLSPKYYGPFKVTDCIGSAAYQLELPPTAGIHNVVHVSQLKLCPNPASVLATPLPVVPVPNQPRGEPKDILDRKMVKRGRLPVTKVLVKWKGFPAELATWEFYYDLLEEFPSFNP